MVHIGDIINYNEQKQVFMQFLCEFSEDKTNFATKRAMYVNGGIGIGKSTFVCDILKEQNFDIIHYDICDLKANIETLTSNLLSSSNITNFFKQTSEKRKIAVVIKDVDSIINTERTVLSTLIKLIRPKKTKKQKNDPIIQNPIIFIGSSITDKKIKELIKVSAIIQLPSPTDLQLKQILDKTDIVESLKSNIMKYTKRDLRKLKDTISLFEKDATFDLHNIFSSISINDTKDITKHLINKKCEFDDNSSLINDTDRTIVSLLWHENIIDIFKNTPLNKSLPIYTSLLQNICFADYIDRITFQNQIWQFNEMTSLLKIFKNNYIIHNESDIKFETIKDIRFTKILTKYSTEYNNFIFCQSLCNRLSLDMKDVHSFFTYFITASKTEESVNNVLEDNDINKLEVARIYRYFEKYTTYYEEPQNETNE